MPPKPTTLVPKEKIPTIDTEVSKYDYTGKINYIVKEIPIKSGNEISAKIITIYGEIQTPTNTIDLRDLGVYVENILAYSLSYPGKIVNGVVKFEESVKGPFSIMIITP